MIRINQLTFSYKNYTVFDNTNFISKSNELTVIKGKSGSGKTTLLDIIALTHGNNFNMQYNGKEVDELFLNNLYYMCQEPFFCNVLTIEEQWCLLKKVYKSEINLDKYITYLGLDDLKMSYPSQLSGGEKLRVHLVNMFIIQPQIILMDEPTASLDDEYKNKFVELLHELKKDKYIIVASHDPHLFFEADTLYEIKQRKLKKVQSKETLSKKVIIQKNTKLEKNWIIYFLKMKRHHKFKEFFTFFLNAIPIAICAFSISMNINFLSLFNQEINTLKDNQALVYKALDRRVPTYKDDVNLSTCFPINEDEYEVLSNIEHIVQLQPKLIFPTYVNELSLDTIYPEFKIIHKDKVVYDYQDQIEELEKQKKYDNIPFYLEGIQIDDLNAESLNVFKENESGIYLNKSLIDDLNLNISTLEDSYLKIKIGIPIYDVSGVMSYGLPSTSADGTLNDDDFVSSNLILYEPKELVLPINGVINAGDESNLVVKSFEKAIYISHGELKKMVSFNNNSNDKVVYYRDSENGLVETHDKSKAEYTHKYSLWKPNAYIFKVDYIDNMDSTIEKMKSLGFSIDYKYNSYKLYANSVKNTQKTIQLVGVSTIAFITFIFFLIHFVKGKEEHELNKWIQSIGYHKNKNILYIKSQRYFINTAITSILSYILLRGISIGYFVYLQQGYAIDIKIILTIVGISIITQYCIPMIWEVCHIDYYKKS